VLVEPSIGYGVQRAIAAMRFAVLDLQRPLGGARQQSDEAD
jgi:hypothetical protein